MIYKTNDTITAISTPPGKGGIGIIRISGKKAKKIAEKISNINLKHGKIKKTTFFDEKKNKIDIGMMSFFKSPNSYTGEDLVEIYTHGNPIILKTIINILKKLGIKSAKKGEFSFRAFYNKKIDLIQAEAINGMIKSNSKNEIINSLKSLEGTFSKKINDINKELIQLRSKIEMIIEFTYTSNEKINKNIIQKSINKIYNIIKKIFFQTKKNNYKIKNDNNNLIIGKTNVGKSSLINKLKNYKISIVSNISGTTRDIIETNIKIKDKNIKFTDTTGIQKTQNLIEKEGIKKTWNYVKNTKNIFLVLDSINEKKNFIYNKITNKKILIIINKIDKISKIKKKNIFSLFNIKKKQIIFCSVKKQLGIQIIKKYIEKINNTNEKNKLFTVGEKQIFLIKKIKNKIKKIKNLNKINEKKEILAEEIKIVQKYISKITGKLTNEKLLNNIFSKFCIGK